MSEFEGRVALVTGAGSGIGRATALAFATAGARVAVCDIDERRGEETAAHAGADAVFLRADMSEPAQVAAVIRACTDRFGRLDYVHNNAGTAGDAAPLHELSEDSWNRTLAVNVTGAWLCLKYALRAMRDAHGEGRAVVNTASVAAEFGFRGLAAYCASKAAVATLTRVAALENADVGIRVNAVSPGMIATPMTAPGGDGLVAGPAPAGRMGTPDEVAAAVLWLCSDAASYVNGTCLVIDGGWTATVGPRHGTAAHG